MILSFGEIMSDFFYRSKCTKCMLLVIFNAHERQGSGRLISFIAFWIDNETFRKDAMQLSSRLVLEKVRDGFDYYPCEHNEYLKGCMQN